MRIARVYDAADPVSGPSFAPDHARIDDTAERERIAAFMRGGQLVMHTTGLDVDRIEPARGEVVPLSFRTDGHWVWTEALGYYVLAHGIAPEPDFCAHMTACRYVAGAPDEEGITEALALLRR